MSTEVAAASLETEYAATNPTSAALFKQQAKFVPSGITHSTRSFDPFPLFVTRCVGGRKWDVDGHEYVDYWLGHGANLLGHSHPVVVDAVREQLEKGFHAGGETEIACEWAELVCRLVPSAEMVRFTASGGEATQLALRIARAATGRNKVVKFQHHYHGWHDAVGVGITPPWDLPYSPGIAPGVLADTVLLPCNDIGLLRSALEENPDIACVILEPGGGYSDTVPIDPQFLAQLPEVTKEHGVVLIFDEVVTGFRYSTGGVQEYYDVLPDLTTLGKVVGGGIPSGAVVGRADLMDLFASGGPTDSSRVSIPHHGTWNANPVAAAAGVATLKIVASGEPTAVAVTRADDLRAGLNALFASLSLPAVAYGKSSIWKSSLTERPKCLDGDFTNYVEEAERLSQGWSEADTPLRQAMLLNGVDLMRANGFTCSAHEENDIELTVQAFDRSIQRLRAQGILTV